jgi:hypothetical protein
MMDIRERVESGNLEEVIRTAVESRQAEMWTSLPGIVEDVDFIKQTMTVRPAIKSVQRKADGSTEHVELPLLKDVPIIFPSGGGMTMTFPIKKGDGVHVTFSSRPTDAHMQSDGVQKQVDARMHHLSDGYAQVGFRPEPRKLKNVPSDATQVRVDKEDGTAVHTMTYHKDNGITTSVDEGKHVVQIHPTTGIKHTSTVAVDIKAPKGTFEVPNMTLKGGLKVKTDDNGHGGWVRADVGLDAPITNGSPGTVPSDEG